METSTARMAKHGSLIQRLGHAILAAFVADIAGHKNMPRGQP